MQQRSGVADPGDKPTPTAPKGEWRRRPFLSWGLRALIFAIPVGFAFGVALLLSRTLPRANSPWTAALWMSVGAVGSLLTLVVFERAARRLLPLAALLNVSLPVSRQGTCTLRSHGRVAARASCASGWSRRTNRARSTKRAT